MSTLWLDTETRSREDISVGSYRYAEHCEITVLAWAVNDSPAASEPWGYGMAGWLSAWISEHDRIVFHNAEFDVPVLEAHGVKIPFSKVYCTQAQARRHGLPGGLDKLCDLFKVGADKAKLKEGHQLVLLFCKPNKDGAWNDATTHPAEWARFLEYAKHDVLAMRELHRLMPRWNDEFEAPHFIQDHKINARGFRVDTDLCLAAIQTMADDKEERDDALAEMTGNLVTSATQRDRILRYLLAEYGVDLPDLTKATLDRRMNDETLPEPVRDLLTLRNAGRRASVSKYKALIKMTCSDGRMRGWRVLNGAARTGRASARGYQAHNQVRPIKSFPDSEIQLGIRAMKAGCLPLINRHPIQDYGAFAVRGTIVAPPGRILHVGDWSNVEGRGLAWLAGEHEVLDAFRAFDAGHGPDLYCVEYAGAFNRDVATVSKDERQVGKVLMLFLGYGGGVAAFITGAQTYGIDLDAMANAVYETLPVWAVTDAQIAWGRAADENRTLGLDATTYVACDALKLLWRRKRQATVGLWEILEAAAIAAVRTGREQAAGEHLSFDMKGSWLRMRLPSGRFLSYPLAKVGTGRFGKPQLSFMGFSPYSRAWVRQTTWGGTLAENATQAMCADILREGMLRAERAGFQVVLDVHDEIVAENNLEQLPALLACMSEPMPWAPDLPLAAAGFTTDRYKKEA